MTHSSHSPIFIVTGPPGAGKTSVCRALMQKFPRGLHIPTDDVREWVVSGRADPVPTWTEETTRQFRLARTSLAQVAVNYAEAGFAVAIDDIIFPEDIADVYEKPCASFPFIKVLLLPTCEVAQHRNAARANKAFNTAILTRTIENLHTSMSGDRFPKDGWIVIDNSKLSIEKTAMQIFEKAGL